MDRRLRIPLRPTILVVLLVGVALLVAEDAPERAVAMRPADRLVAITAPSPTARAEVASPQATPRGKGIYKGHTLEEIRADPSLLAEILAEGDSILPVHGEPYPPLMDSGVDHACPNHVECPSTGGTDAFLKAQFALMEASGSDCVSSHEGQTAIWETDFEEIAAGIGPEGGVLPDGRGWVGTPEGAQQHFGGAEFVAQDRAEHWFLTSDAATLRLLYATRGPAAAALIEVQLADGRTVWYLGPRWFVSVSC